MMLVADWTPRVGSCGVPTSQLAMEAIPATSAADSEETEAHGTQHVSLPSQFYLDPDGESQHAEILLINSAILRP